MFTIVEKNVLFYNNWQKTFEKENNPKIEYRQGLPSEDDFKMFSNDDHQIIVIDDLQFSALNDVPIFSVESAITEILVYC